MEVDDIIDIQLEKIGKLSVKLNSLKNEKVDFMCRENDMKMVISELNIKVRNLEDELKMYKEANEKLINKK